MIVIDASIAAKWYLPEAGNDRADALLEANEELCAPAIIRIEVLSAVSRRHCSGGIGAVTAQEMMAEWLEDLDGESVTLWPDDLDLDAAMRFSIRIHHALVDCLYLACAVRLGAELITTDQNLLNRARALHPRIRIL
jgi:predicted nucleic acid-binding protein